MYQKTISDTLTKTSAAGTATTTYLNIGANVDKIISIDAFVDNSSGIHQPIPSLQTDSSTGAVTKYLRINGTTNTYSTQANKNQILVMNAWYPTTDPVSLTVYATVKYTKS